jgi:hypothetical protein
MVQTSNPKKIIDPEPSGKPSLKQNPDRVRKTSQHRIISAQKQAKKAPQTAQDRFFLSSWYGGKGYFGLKWRFHDGKRFVTSKVVGAAITL